MKKLLSILLTIAMLVSLCVQAFADEPDYTSGTPWLCIDLDGTVTEDTPTNLKDNFILAVEKDKLLSLRIPEGYSRIGRRLQPHRYVHSRGTAAEGRRKEHVSRRGSGGTRYAPGL